MDSPKDFALTRSIQPYVGYVVIFGAITLLAIFTSIKTRDLTPIGMIVFCWILGIATRYGDTRYRIFWRHGVIEQVATNGAITTIRASDIVSAKLEQSDLATLVTFSRPSRRITVYG